MLKHIFLEQFFGYKVLNHLKFDSVILEASALLGNIQSTDLMLVVSPLFCASVASSCFLSCASKSDTVRFLSKGKEDATAEAASTNSGLRGLLL